MSLAPHFDPVLLSKTSLPGHVALVTGANHGIGAAISRALATAGAGIFLTSYALTTEPMRVTLPLTRRTGPTRSEVVVAIRKSGGEAECLEADVSDPAMPRVLFDAAEAAFGPVDILVNNASGWFSPPDAFPPSRALELGAASATAFLDDFEDLRDELRPFLREQLSADDFSRLHAWGDAFLLAERDSPQPQALIHGDFWTENILVDERRETVRGIIDFVDAMLCDCAHDFMNLGAGVEPAHDVHNRLRAQAGDRGAPDVFKSEEERGASVGQGALLACECSRPVRVVGGNGDSIFDGVRLAHGECSHGRDDWRSAII